MTLPVRSEGRRIDDVRVRDRPAHVSMIEHFAEERALVQLPDGVDQVTLSCRYAG